MEIVLPGGVRMEFVFVPKGTFWMSRDDKNAQQYVRIERAFFIGKYEVTQEQWQAVMGKNPSKFSRTGSCKERVKSISDADLKRFPVENVSWNDCQEFLEKLNALTKKRGFELRLPSEAEWEYACRAAVQTKEGCSFDFYVAKPSDDLSSQEANFNGSSPVGTAPKGKNLARTTRVGSYRANALGIYDMHGNTWEWCQDRESGSAARRVLRGGSWHSQVRYLRALYRHKHQVSDHNYSLGFRCVEFGSLKKLERN